MTMGERLRRAREEAGCLSGRSAETRSPETSCPSWSMTG